MKDKKGLDVVIALGKPKGKGPECDMCEGEGCPFCEEGKDMDEMEDEEYDDFEEEDEEEVEMPEDEEEMDMGEEPVSILDAIKNEDPVMFEEQLRAMVKAIIAESK
jgi:hypothetical protein